MHCNKVLHPVIHCIQVLHPVMHCTVSRPHLYHSGPTQAPFYFENTLHPVLVVPNTERTGLGLQLHRNESHLLFRDQAVAGLLSVVKRNMHCKTNLNAKSSLAKIIPELMVLLQNTLRTLLSSTHI